MKKMNIAIVCDPIGKEIAGAFISTIRFAVLLKKRGHNVVIIAARYPSTEKVEDYQGIKIYRFASVKVPKSENHYLGFPSKRKIKKILLEEKIEIVHFMLPMPSALSAIRAAKELKIKLVAHSHSQPENIFMHLPKILTDVKLDEAYYRYMLWVYRKADIVICPSKFSERLLNAREKGLKTVVVSNGVDSSKFRKKDYKGFLKQHKLDPSHKRILFVGRLHPEKCVDTLIEAMPMILEKFNNVHLDIVGIGNLRDSLEELAKNLKIEKHVTFFGRVSDNNLVKAYNAGYIFVLPSLAELEGMVVLEAMACGKPLLIANSVNSASVDFVKDNGFLFEPKNPEDLANKAIKILENKKLRNKMAKRSFEASKEYEINKSISKIEKIYSGLI